MREWTVFILFLLACRGLAAGTHHVPGDADDHGPNLPAVGSSLFDKIYSRTASDGRTAYDVPFPLERLMDKVTSREGEFVHVMFPFSRSLQRPRDLSYDPLLNPRLVFAPTKEQDSIVRAKIFIGYVKAKDQLEVISYNDEAGRFEYQIVAEYSRDPKVFYADRGKCLSCHQGQAPIFSTPGWDDSSFGILGNLILSKLGLRGNSAENKKIAFERLFGTTKSRDNIATFDSLVRDASKIALDERIWVVGCGSDRACRLGLLLNALVPNSRYTGEYLQHAREVLHRSPLRRQVYFSSFLTPSSFGAIHVIKKYGSYDQTAHDPLALLEIIGLLYNLSPADNPATPRPATLDGVASWAPLSGILLTDQDRLRQEVPDPDRIATNLIRRFENDDPIFAPDAINKLEILRAVLADAGSDEAETYGQWLRKATPPKVLFEGPLPPTFRQAELNIFSRHCAKCHAAGTSFPPQFLLGSEEQVARAISELKGRILFKLESGLMPPNKLERDILKTSGDLDRILAYLNRP